MFLVAFTVFLLLMECLGWMLVKFTVFLAFMRHSGWSCLWHSECLYCLWGIGVGPRSCGVYSVSSVYGALGLNVSCGVYCVFIVNGVLGMDAC